MKKEEYLLEFQAKADSIVEKYLNAYDESDLEPDKYINTIHLNVQNELGRSISIITERSSKEGVGFVVELNKRLVEESEATIKKLEQGIAIRFKNKKQ